MREWFIFLYPYSAVGMVSMFIGWLFSFRWIKRAEKAESEVKRLLSREWEEKQPLLLEIERLTRERNARSWLEK